jgi:alpha-glucosidase
MSDWWRHGVVYQIYPRSFADSNGDGVGDLGGITARLDHLEWLGVDGIWLSPITVSPNADWGYDVADYLAVDPSFGTLADLDTLIAEAGRRGISILIDLVPNHTSDRHPWFVEARTSREAEHRDWYVWADAKPDGSLPNNWVSCFGGPAWTRDDASGQYYLHNFLPEQPDLNWWNEDVREAFDGILRFWFGRGIAGFRIDVATMIVKDAELRDNPPATEADQFWVQMMGQRQVYNSNRPEVHEVLRRWRTLADAEEPHRLLLGETNVGQMDVLTSYYGNGSDELHLAFNFMLIESAFEAGALRGVVENVEAMFPPGSWPVWTGSNHDVPRLATRWAGGDPAKIRCALMMLLTLRGTPVVYFVDEVGVVDTRLTKEDLQDPVGVRFWPAYAGRDAQRTPMPWANRPGAGFTDAPTRPWLPFGDLSTANVEDQRADTGSILHLTRDLIALRRRTPALHSGTYRSLTAPAGVWAWARDPDAVVILNLSDERATTPLPGGATIAICTNRGRDGEQALGTSSLNLAAWEGVVLITDRS